MNHDYYRHLDLPPLPDRYIQEGLNANYKVIEKPRLIWARSTFDETDFFKEINEHFGRCYVKYYFNPPDSLYDWHVDSNRHCAINWVVKTNPEARAIFREPSTDLNQGLKKPIFYDIHELKYQGSSPTILNATYEHCIANNYPDTRIILTMSVFKPATYHEVLDFILNMKCKDY